MSFEAKETLPIDFVLDYFGHKPAVVESEALLYFVPWRNDSKPSLAVFPTEGSPIYNRWADRARQDGSDVYDLISRLLGDDAGYGAIFGKVEEISAAYENEGWQGHEVPERKTLSIDDMRDHVARAQLDSAPSTGLVDWLRHRDFDFGVDWLETQWGVAWSGTALTMPYFDEAGEVVGYRYRTINGIEASKPLSPAGSSITHGYGLQHHEDGRPFLIVEGESDTWVAHEILGDQFNVVGIPGSSIHPNKIETGIGGYPVRVYLAFDGDDAGRDANRKWAQHLTAKGHAVFIVPIPDGKDLGDVNQNLGPLMMRALPVRAHTPGLVYWGGRIFRATKDGEAGMPLSDFDFRLVRRIETEDGPAYEVKVGEGGVTVHTVTTVHLLNKRNFTAWCAERDLMWNGSDNDVSILRSNLSEESRFVPVVKGTPVAGLHDGAFVYPGGSIGDLPMTHLNDSYDRGFTADDMIISSRPSKIAAIDSIYGFLELSDHDLTTPMLAWLMACPLRSTVKEFPYLSLSGEFGVGKSGYLEKYIPIISGVDRRMQLGNRPTAYSMASLAAGSNAFPVMFDEYRTNNSLANKETLEQMDNLLRASWNAGVRETGGHPLDPKRIQRFPISAPIVAGGEDEKQTGSTRQRMVPIYLTAAKRGSDDRIMRYYGESHVASLYLQWLQLTGESLVTRESGPEDLDIRPRYTIGYLEQGWALLNDWLLALGHVFTVDLDLSSVIDTFRDHSAHHPLLNALAEVMGATASRMDRPVWEEDGLIYVRPGPFVAEANRLNLDVGNAASVGKMLTAVFGAGSQKRDGGPVRTFDATLLDVVD